jgi:hypothetical protein
MDPHIYIYIQVYIYILYIYAAVAQGYSSRRTSHLAVHVLSRGLKPAACYGYLMLFIQDKYVAIQHDEHL